MKNLRNIPHKKKTARVSKGVRLLIDQKGYGKEPELTGTPTESELGTALNWYSSMCGAEEAREFLKAYFQFQNRTEDLRLLSKLTDPWIPRTAAWIARLMTLEVDLHDRHIEFCESKISEALARVEESVDVEREPVSDRIREKAGEIIGDIEALIDTYVDFSMYDWLKEREIKAVYVPYILERYVPWYDELLETLVGKDQQLKEAYSYMTKKELRERAEFFRKLITDAERYADNTRKVRAPRAAKPVSIEKQVSRLQFQKEFKAFKIVSVDPSKVIGAKELWTVNTRYKIVSVYRSETGLGFRGTSIVNYDEKSSTTWRIGRKIEAAISTILKGTKASLKKFNEGTEAALAPRINDNTVLLRVIS